MDQTERYTNWVYNHLLPDKYKIGDGSEESDLSVMEKRLFQIFPLEGIPEDPNKLELVAHDFDLSTGKLNTLKHIMDAGLNSRLNIDHSQIDKLLFNLLSKAINLSTTELRDLYESITKKFRKIPNV